MMKSRLFGRVLTTTGLIAAAGFATSAYADTVQVVGRAGDGLVINGTNYQALRLTTATGAMTAPVISDAGHIVFHAQLAGQLAGTQNVLVRMDSSGEKLVLARTGSTWATGQPAFASFGAPMVNDIGQVAFPGTVSGTGVTSTNDSGFWHFDGSRVSSLAREGSQAPGASGNFSSFADTAVAKSAQNHWVSIKSTLTGTGVNGTNNKALHEMNSATSLGAVATAGATAPGTTVGFYDVQRACNDLGGMVVYSTLQGTGITTSNNQGIWRDGTSGLALLVRSGSQAPGAATGTTFTSLFSTASKPVINNSGRIAFMGTTAAAGGYGNGGGVWLSNGSQLEPIVISGMASPDVGLGSCLMSGGTEPNASRCFYLTDDNRVLFWTLLSGSSTHSGNNVAMMQSRIDSAGRRVVEPIIRGGMQCPGAEPGVTISNASLGQTTRVNRNGDAFFWVELQSPSIAAGTDRALLRWSGSELSLVIRNGDSIPGLDGVVLAQAGSTAPTLFMNDLGQAVMLSGSVNTLTGALNNWALSRVDELGQVRGVAVNSGPMLLSDRSAPLVNNFTIGPNCLSNTGDFVFSTQTLTGVTGDVIVKVHIQAESTPPPQACPADMNGDRELTQQDLFDFLADWFSATGRSDFNHDSQVSVEDIFQYFAEWAAGSCP